MPIWMRTHGRGKEWGGRQSLNQANKDNGYGHQTGQEWCHDAYNSEQWESEHELDRTRARTWTGHKTMRQSHLYSSCPQSAMVTVWLVLPLWLPTRSTRVTTSIPSITRPNTTCLPSSHLVWSVQMKNWEPFVFGPALAMLKIPVDDTVMRNAKQAWVMYETCSTQERRK